MNSLYPIFALFIEILLSIFCISPSALIKIVGNFFTVIFCSLRKVDVKFKLGVNCNFALYLFCFNFVSKMIFATFDLICKFNFASVFIFSKVSLTSFNFRLRVFKKYFLKLISFVVIIKLLIFKFFKYSIFIGLFLSSSFFGSFELFFTKVSK